ncbi:MAG: undecaprenyldiphospho-muramoylpentapeptide beta-N-acetylglucosaminyltransferase [Alphaproteobacteria bacterium]|nr:undecaprenyldiphospho-muramoylpentapeptide beta-N-acetylglucosaminyltransferase [Alphaproteobacteria bacterium]MBV8547891.1 undecaprenyldiphospho-muramoylpentapeptide beta-N-acetylglucosaminyltransferase [Alphaproteobacteria bacterium]
MNTPAPLILLAAGGTGGHVFPAEALARELLGRGLRVGLITDQRGNKFSDDLGIPVYRVAASALGKGFLAKLRSIAVMGFGVWQAGRTLKQLRPAAIVGFGGYPSVPSLYAAVQRHVPIILHEQNAILGRANRVLMNKASIVATSFPHVVGLKPGPSTRLVHTGNPVRPAFATLRATPYPALEPEGMLHLLVLGGSLGARIFSSAVPHALALLPEPMRRRIIVSQQCRKENIEEARAAYAAAGIHADLATFFNDVPDRMAAAHLFVGRSGGSTVAELTAVGRPAIFVPFPHGHAGEQTANAEAVAEAGGAWLIPEHALTPETLAVRIESLMQMPETLNKAAMASRAWGTISAADNLADCVLEAIGHAPSRIQRQDTNTDTTLSDRDAASAGDGSKDHAA